MVLTVKQKICYIERNLCLLLSLQTCHHLCEVFFKASLYNVFAVVSTTINDAFVVLDLSLFLVTEFINFTLKPIFCSCFVKTYLVCQ